VPGGLDVGEPRSPAEYGELRQRLRRERAEHDERDEHDIASSGGGRRARRAALVGLVVLGVVATLLVLRLVPSFGGPPDVAFDPSNPPEALALCRDYILTGPHAEPGADALVVDAAPGQPVRLPAGSSCPLVLEIRAPDGSFIQYVGSEESP
jgi:hypothetical protein